MHKRVTSSILTLAALVTASCTTSPIATPPTSSSTTSSTTPTPTSAPTARAFVRVVPERKDDVAWENDRVAFRNYGPALRDGPEASGIDVWAKRTRDLVIDRWYADDLAGKRSYHQDHGEGYDGYSVGDSAGCGGAGVWVDHRFVVPDVYDTVTILHSAGDAIEFVVTYTYPTTPPLHESRRIRLAVGDNQNQITSRFSYDREGRMPAKDIIVGTGLMAQTRDAIINSDPASGEVQVVDRLVPGNESLALTLTARPGGEVVRVPHETTPRADQVVYLTNTDADGTVTYRAGFTWSGEGKPPGKPLRASDATGGR